MLPSFSCIESCEKDKFVFSCLISSLVVATAPSPLRIKNPIISIEYLKLAIKAFL